MIKKYGFPDILLWFLAPIISFSYIVTPLTNDARIYLGVAHIASHYYPFPQGIDLAWEIKPVMNRFINYLLYQTATLFVPFANHFWFGVAVKTLSLIAVIIVAWYFSRTVGGVLTFFLVFFSLTTLANFCILQAEFWAVLFALMAIAFLLTDSPSLNSLAGAFIMIIVFFKGITGLLLIPVICGAYLLYKSKREFDFIILDALLGFIIAGVIFLVASVTIWPHMVSDMLMSSHLARVGQLPLINYMVFFFSQLILSPIYIPVLLMGIVLGAIYFFARIRIEPLNTRLAYELMWIVPALIVFIQGEMFFYHYLVFIPSAIVTLLLCERSLKI